MTTTLINTFQESCPHPLVNPPKLPEGWHHTERWGEVFVTPGGSAWVVQHSNDRLINVTVIINLSDIIKTPAIDRVKHAQAMRHYRKNTKVSITQTANLPLSEAESVDK
jgi:hypothetical protein